MLDLIYASYFTLDLLEGNVPVGKILNHVFEGHFLAFEVSI